MTHSHKLKHGVSQDIDSDYIQRIIGFVLGYLEENIDTKVDVKKNDYDDSYEIQFHFVSNYFDVKELQMLYFKLTQIQFQDKGKPRNYIACPIIQGFGITTNHWKDNKDRLMCFDLTIDFKDVIKKKKRLLLPHPEGRGIRKD